MSVKKIRHFSVSLMRNIEKIIDTHDDVIKIDYVKRVKFAEAVIDTHKRKKSLGYHILEIFPVTREELQRVKRTGVLAILLRS